MEEIKKNLLETSEWLIEENKEEFEKCKTEGELESLYVKLRREHLRNLGDTLAYDSPWKKEGLL